MQIIFRSRGASFLLPLLSESRSHIPSSAHSLPHRSAKGRENSSSPVFQEALPQATGPTSPGFLMGGHPAAKPQLPLFPLILTPFQLLFHTFGLCQCPISSWAGRNPLCGWVWGRVLWPVAVHRLLTARTRKGDNQGKRSIYCIRGTAGAGGLCHAPHLSDEPQAGGLTAAGATRKPGPADPH